MELLERLNKERTERAEKAQKELREEKELLIQLINIDEVPQADKESCKKRLVEISYYLKEEPQEAQEANNALYNNNKINIEVYKVLLDKTVFEVGFDGDFEQMEQDIKECDLQGQLMQARGKKFLKLNTGKSKGKGLNVGASVEEVREDLKPYKKLGIRVLNLSNIEFCINIITDFNTKKDIIMWDSFMLACENLKCNTATLTFGLGNGGKRRIKERIKDGIIGCKGYNTNGLSYKLYDKTEEVANSRGRNKIKLLEGESLLRFEFVLGGRALIRRKITHNNLEPIEKVIKKFIEEFQKQSGYNPVTKKGKNKWNLNVRTISENILKAL